MVPRASWNCWRRSRIRPGAYLRAMRELLQGLRQHAADAIFAWAAKFSLPTARNFPDPLLSRLAFFARYESLLACLSGRHARCEPHAVQLLLGKVMELRCCRRRRSSRSCRRGPARRAGRLPGMAAGVATMKPAGRRSWSTATTPAAAGSGKASRKPTWRWWA